MTNRHRLVFALVAYLVILAMGGGALYALVRITDPHRTQGSQK